MSLQVQYEKGSYYFASEWSQIEPKFFSPRSIRSIVFADLLWHADDLEESIAHRMRRHMTHGGSIAYEQYCLLTTRRVLFLCSDDRHKCLDAFDYTSAFWRPFVLLADEIAYLELLRQNAGKWGTKLYINPSLFPGIVNV